MKRKNEVKSGRRKKIARSTQAFRCLICWENFNSGNKCRRCKQSICHNCMHGYVVANANKKNLECPHCRQHFFKPNFFVKCKGQKFSTDKSLFIYCGGSTRYFLHAVHDDTDVVGYVSLEHSTGWKPGLSYHIDDLLDLEKFAKPLPELVGELAAANGCVTSRNDTLLGHLSLLGIHFRVLGSCVLIECFEDYFKGCINPF